jgi:hypothetical protein
MSRRRLIGVLMALHPRRWRTQYGAELRDLVESGPVTAAVVIDTLRNAARQHARQHPVATRVIVALAASAAVEIVAVRAGVTDNILWMPSTPLRGAVLAALLLPWLPAALELILAARRRWRRATADK